MSHQEKEFEQLSQKSSSSLPAQVLRFVLENKVWWLAPVILVLLLLGILVALGGSGAAPFIYTLF